MNRAFLQRHLIIGASGLLLLGALAAVRWNPPGRLADPEAAQPPREAEIPAAEPHLRIKALGDEKHPAAVPTLVQIASSDPSVESRRVAVRALENFADDPAAIAALRAAATRDPDAFVRKNAVRSLVRMAPPELIDCLYELKSAERDPTVLAVIDRSLANGGGR